MGTHRAPTLAEIIWPPGRPGEGRAIFLRRLRPLPVIVAIWTSSFFVPYSSVGNLLQKAGFVLCSVSWLCAMAIEPGRLRSALYLHRWLLSVAAAFFLWLFASVLWAADQLRVLSELWKYGLAIGVLLIIVTITRDRLDVLILVSGWAAGGVLAAVSAASSLQAISVTPIDPLTSLTNRFAGSSGDPNILAVGVVAAAVLLCGLTACIPARWRPLSLGSLPLLAAVAAGSGSRGGAVAAAVAATVAVVAFRRNIFRVLLLLIPAAAGAAFWFSHSPDSWTRISSFEGGGNGRESLWVVAVRLAADNPVLGVGLDNFRVLAPGLSMNVGSLKQAESVSGAALVVHNTYLQYAAEAGLTGLLLFGSVLVLSMGSAFQAAHHFARHGDTGLAILAWCVVIATAALLAGGLFLSMGREYRLWALLALGPALLNVATCSADTALAAVWRRRDAEPVGPAFGRWSPPCP